MRCARAIFAGLVLASLAGTAPAQERAASVTAEKVDVRAIADTSPVLGQLVASVQADVASRRAGVADAVLFAIGDLVEEGAPLVRLETRLTEIERRAAEADLAVAQAGVAVAEASVALALQGLARQDRLQGSTAFSQGIFEDLQQSVELARGELARAQAQIASAEARLARVDYDLENAILRAPFTGVVIERMAQPGQYVSLGEAVAKLLDVGGLEIEADVPVELIRGLAPGTDVAVSFADGAEGRAQVRSALPVETVSTRTRPVRFETDLSGVDPLLIAVGKTVTLRIPISAPRDVVTVPKDALVQGRDGWVVFVVEDGQAMQRAVTLGQSAGNRLEVLTGLAPGDVVVVRGNERLRPGQAVTATFADG